MRWMIAAVLAVAQPALAQEGPVVAIAWENDLFVGRDRNYTNGVRLAYAAPRGLTHGWMTGARSTLLPGATEVTSAYALGQKMFTASDIADPDPPLDDRPYAGWAYAEAALTGTRGDRMQAWRAGIGIVGPASLAEEAQRLVHDLSGVIEPQGWDTQLPTEPTLHLGYETRWQRTVWRREGGALEADVVPVLGAVLGNAYTYAEAGAKVRFGRRLPRDWGGYRAGPAASGATLAGPAEGFGWHVFAGVDGRAFARDLFLDGSTFRDSRSVDKTPFVGDLTLGAALTWDRLRVGYTHVLRTETFETEQVPADFGALSIAVRF